jgi:hypothetical protein
MSQLPPPIPDTPTPRTLPTDLPPVAGWPKTVGIISIVYGSIGILCNGCGVLKAVTGPMLTNWAKGMVPANQQAQMTSVPPSPLGIATASLGFLWAILLIVAGSMLVARQARARTLHLVWAVIQLGLWVMGLISGLEETKQQLAQMASQPTGGFKADQMKPVFYGVFACILVVLLIYPVFTLIWFGLVKRDTHEITSGYEEPIL